MKKTTLSILFLINSFAIFAQIDLNKGLMLYLPFKGNTLDASPNGNHAINYGATLTADQWGNPNSAYRFDGTSNYMRVTSNITLSPSEFTLCARVNLKGFYNGLCYNNVIFAKGAPDYKAGNYSLRTSQTISSDCNFQDILSHNYRCDVKTVGTTLSNINTTPYIVPNNWDCLIGIYKNDTVVLYVNGIMRYKYYEPSIGVNSDDLFIGKHNSNEYPFWFNGIMDEVRIYNRALNILEIDSVCSESNPQLAIREVKEAEVLPIMSNPVNNELVLGLEDRNMGGTLTIRDLSGRKLIQVAKLNEKTVSLENLSAGVYLVTYQLEDTLMRVKVLKRE